MKSRPAAFWTVAFFWVCLLATPSTAHGHACNFSAFILKNAVNSWEFQLDVPQEKCSGPRSGLLAAAAAAVNNVTSSAGISVVLLDFSLRTSILDQYSTALTTLDARPLFPTAQAPKKYPWQGPAFIRHRRKHARYTGLHGPWDDHQALNATHLAQREFQVRAGSGDLTVKIKDIDLKRFRLLHEELDLPRCRERWACSSLFCDELLGSVAA